MPDIGLSAAIVTRSFLEPAMDGRAHNLDQDRLIFNPATREVDSLFEHIEWLEAKVNDRGQVSSSLADLAAITTALAESNYAEGRSHMLVAGAADQLAHDLRAAETRGMPAELTIKGIARRLRGPLGVLVERDRHSLRNVARALDQVREVRRTVPRAQLLSDQVLDQLRPRKAAVLRDLLANESGAALVGPADATAGASPLDEL